MKLWPFALELWIPWWIINNQFDMINDHAITNLLYLAPHRLQPEILQELVRDNLLFCLFHIKTCQYAFHLWHYNTGSPNLYQVLLLLRLHTQNQNLHPHLLPALFNIIILKINSPWNHRHRYLTYFEFAKFIICASFDFRFRTF